MGICISLASSNIHAGTESGICSGRGQNLILETEDGHGNVLFYQETVASNATQALGSLWSKKGSKEFNQDFAILYQNYGTQEGVFCGVFDGHGKNGHIVSKIVRNGLPSLLLSQKNALANINMLVDEDDHHNFHTWKQAFINAFKVMDKEIKLLENLDCSGSGTTAVVVVRQGEDLVMANLGDSRAVLGTMTENGVKAAVQLTTDLKPGLPCEAERIRKCNGRVIALKEEAHIERVWLPHEDSPGLAMSRAFGDFMLKDYGVIAIPEITHHSITSDDHFLLLATDGVWDVLNNNQVASIVWSANSQEAAARAVVEAAEAAWKNKFPSSKVDDCTAVCLFLQTRQHLDEP